MVTELQDMRGNATDKHKMIEMLQRQQQAAIEGEPQQDLSERLSDVHLDNSDVLWERLSESEKLMFQERLRKGHVDFLDVWKPWWERFVFQIVSNCFSFCHLVIHICRYRDVKKFLFTP